MNIAVTSPIGGSETQHRSYNALHLNTEQSSPPAQQRRHVHYSTPEASTPLSPHLVFETAVSHTLRSSSNSNRSTSSMSQSTSATPPGLDAPAMQPFPLEDGQNHDRMETDMHTDHASSEGGVREPPGGAADSILMEIEPPEDGEIMDTRPDSVTPEAPPVTGEGIATGDVTSTADASTTGNPNLVRISSNGSTIDSDADDLTLPDVVARIIDPAPALARTSTPPPLPPDGADPTNITSRLAPGSDADVHAAAARTNEDDSFEEDSDEEDVPYWANLKEDDSSPDEKELEEIHAKGVEVNALDHDHWERLTYEPLDDPEYIPSISGRITWTVKGVNGTLEKPNRKTLMRSPSVLIGGYYWNIKYFPRGDEGTQYMSVFIECSTKPREEVTIEETDIQIPDQEKTNDHASSTAQATEERSLSTGLPESSTNIIVWGVPLSSDALEVHPPINAALPVGDTPKEHVPEAEYHWEVAAQVGCVVYNPEEPRVHASQTSSHHFYDEHPDFGWIRFHGPWDEIHKRQHCQRQALLRNDTLVFTAYIRIVEDDTKALWWHAPKDTSRWDSLARTGLRQFTTGTLYSSAVISAISAWLNLGTVANLILNMHIPDSIKEPKSRPRPLFLALQLVVSGYFDGTNPREPETSLDGVIRAMDWYGAELDPKMDVVAIWEIMRRILNFEASEIVNVADARDLFRNVLMLKQPDPWRDEQPINSDSIPDKPDQPLRAPEPHNVQEAFNLAITGESYTFRGWEGTEAEPPNLANLPPVIQLELHRQSYNKELRQWKKLTHQIKINETLVVNLNASDQKAEYTLRCMIVHSGNLESKNYSAIIRRPQKEGARWVKYAGEHEEKSVTFLTREQAITSHEGIGNQATGNAAVAYVVLYERTDSPSKILLTPPVLSKDSDLDENVKSTISESSRSEADQGKTVVETQRSEKALSVHVYPSTSFIDYSGRGFMDAGCWPGREAIELEVPATTTVGELRKHVFDHSVGEIKAEKLEQFRLWALDFGTQYTRGSPMFLPPNSEQWAGLKLDEFGRNVGGCHLWLHELPKLVDDGSTDFYKKQCIEPVDTTSMHVDPSSSDGAQVSEVQTPGVEAGGAVIIEEPRNSSQVTNGAPENEDVVMDGAPESAAPDTSDASATMPPNAESPEEDEKEAYIFLKVFNHHNQSLHGKGSYVVQRQDKVKDTVRQLLGPDCPNNIDVYQEQYLTISDDDLVQVNQTFADVDVCDGEIFIAHHRPSAAEITALDASGKCPTPVSYFKYLRHHDNPAYAHPHTLSSFFSSPYLSTAQSSGRPHGPGTYIALSGDAFVGTFVAGTKSGHGTMAFANGDTYTGAWADNEPNGQGKMVYAGTGNTYVGGFRKRKRHGKGTMHFEVADEELQLCRICYEMEMDALFYDCGHVAACVECARQVSACPVCRKGVRGVVRIWRT